MKPTQTMKHAILVLGLAALIVGVAVTVSDAGTTGDEFEDAYDTLVGWINGFLGRSLAIAFLLVGLFMGIARQNLIACGVSIAAAFGLLITPTVLDNILTVTASAETFTVLETGPE